MRKEKKCRKDVGFCKIGDGENLKIEKSFWRQGRIFKSWDAYYNREKEPCYVPELSDSVYTSEDFFRICNEQREFADELFEAVDWQHPESLLEDWQRNNEWVNCPKCGKLVDFGDGNNDKKCRLCGAEIGGE